MNYTKKKRQRDPENIELATEYRTYCNKLNELIETTKTSYYMKKIEESKNNCKALWKTIKKIDGGKSKNKIKKIIYTEGTQITQEEEMCQGFNKFFTNIGKELVASYR